MNNDRIVPNCAIMRGFFLIPCLLLGVDYYLGTVSGQIETWYDKK
jgi:hypothetical protein